MLGTWGSTGAYISALLPAELDPSHSERRVWLWVAIAASGMAALLLLATLAMVRRIKVCCRLRGAVHH
jgi:hypothetical protein